IDGVSVATAAWSGPFPSTLIAGQANLNLGDGAAHPNWRFAELAVYRYVLPAARVAAHYDAATNKGLAAQASGARIGAILDRVPSQAPRRIGTGVRSVTSSYFPGQPPLAE